MTEPLFWRNPVPLSICSCRHSLPAHRIDLKTQPCDATDCTCRAFDLTVLRWTEHRIVDERVQP